jgi:hypothetical protein
MEPIVIKEKELIDLAIDCGIAHKSESKLVEVWSRGFIRTKTFMKKMKKLKRIRSEFWNKASEIYPEIDIAKNTYEISTYGLEKIIISQIEPPECEK